MIKNRPDFISAGSRAKGQWIAVQVVLNVEIGGPAWGPSLGFVLSCIGAITFRAGNYFTEVSRKIRILSLRSHV